MRRNCSGMVGPSLLKINQKQQEAADIVLCFGIGIRISTRKKNVVTCRSVSHSIDMPQTQLPSHPIPPCLLHSFLFSFFFFLVALLPAGVACQRGEQEKRSLSSTRLTKSAFHAGIKAARYN